MCFNEPVLFGEMMWFVTNQLFTLRRRVSLTDNSQIGRLALTPVATPRWLPSSKVYELAVRVFEWQRGDFNDSASIIINIERVKLIIKLVLLR